MSDQLSGILLGALVLVVCFLISRAIWLWYWKVNEVVALLKDISGSLRIMRGAPAEIAAPVPWYDEVGALHSETEKPPDAGTTPRRAFRTKAEYDAWKAEKTPEALMAYKFIPPGRTNYYIAWTRPDGKERRKSTGTDNERAADNILSKVKVELAEGRFLEKKLVATMTLKKFGEKFYLPRMARLKPRSAAWRKDRWSQVLAVLGKEMPLDQANRPETVERYVDARLGRVSLTTVKLDVAVFRHGMRMAARWKSETDVEEYRLHDWRPPEDPRPPAEPEPVDPHAWDAILAKGRARAARGRWADVHGLAVTLLARTIGARRGEVLRLRRADVDLKRGIVRRLVLKKRTLGEKKETAIAGEPLELLRRVARSHEHDLIFCNPKTGMERKDIKAFWDAVRRDLAGARPKFHGIRHAFGRDYLADGHDLRELKDRLGHSSIRTTEKYSHMVKRKAPPKGLGVDMKPYSQGVSQPTPRRPSRPEKAGTKSARSRGNAKISSSAR